MLPEMTPVSWLMPKPAGRLVALYVNGRLVSSVATIARLTVSPLQLDWPPGFVRVTDGQSRVSSCSTFSCSRLRSEVPVRNAPPLRAQEVSEGTSRRLRATNRATWLCDAWVLLRGVTQSGNRSRA